MTDSIRVTYIPVDRIILFMNKIENNRRHLWVESILKFSWTSLRFEFKQSGVL